MLHDQTISIIGVGAMGEAILAGLLRQQLVHAEQVLATHRREDRRNELHSRYGVQVTSDNRAAAQHGQIVIFALKPQTLTRGLPELRDAIGSQALVISIAAGVSLRLLADGLGHSAVVRSMPNTPAQIGEGMTVWTASEAVSAQQRDWARAVLGSFGRQLFVDDENYLDMATAINGTGPAYFFLVLEAMIDAGVHLGLPRYMAEELVLQTMLGSVRFAMQSGLHPAELRNAVTSPAGTTAAALNELERGSLRSVLGDAIWAAYRRSAELGKGK